jgi:serine/threonine-protein kinase
MLTGRRAFDGEDMTDVLGAVVRLEPDWTALPPDVPPAIRTLLQRCLVKDCRRRVGDVAAVLFVLNNVASLVAGTNAAESDAAVSTASVEVRRWRRRTGWIAAAALVLVGAAIGISVWRMPRPISAAMTRAAIVLTPDLAVSGQGVALTPDGRTLAIPAGNRLVLRSLDREDARPLPGTEGATLPFFSPDGAWVGYVANGELRKIRIDGTTPRTISKALGVFTPPWWAADDTILFSVLGTGLFRVPAAGGTPELFTEARRDEGEITHGWPQMLPGGRTVLFTVTRASGSTAAVLPLDSRAWRILPQVTGSSAMYVPSGHLVFVSGNTFFAAPFDPASAIVTGMAVPVADRVERTFAIARNGTMAFLFREQPPSTGYQGVIVASDREGSLSMVRGQEIVTIQGASGGGMSFSPDGTRFAAGLRVPGNDSNRSHLWSYDLARGTRVQLTDRGPINAGPKWSVDGSRVAFTSTRETPGIYVQSPDPGSPVTLLLPRRQNVQSPQSLGSDSSLIYVEADPRTGFDVWVRDSHGATRTLLATPANERSPRLSPDGRWLAYASDVSGQSEVYVRPHSAPGRTEVVSNTGGSEPRWAGSRELIYRRGREVVAVPMVASGDAIAPGQPHVLFEIDDHPLNYDVSSDGTKFLFLQRADDNESIPAQVTLMLNWFEELKRLVPAK